MNQPGTLTPGIYCYCMSDGTDERTMVQCDYCDSWFHLTCLNPVIPEDDLPFYIKYHCKECVPIRGDSIFRLPTRKSTRDRPKPSYLNLHNGKGGESRWSQLLTTKKFIKYHRFARFATGHSLTKEWLESTGFRTPIIIEDSEGLGMRMPPTSLSVSDVADSVGRDTVVEVLYVPTQSERRMTLDDWAKYFEQPEGQREGILNVITLEISSSPLGKMVQRPTIVSAIDWIDHVWPAKLKPLQYPKVQLYCLMSVKDSYTDFHVDFGGSSVFYHILSGGKTFYFVEPTPQNLKKYAEWSTSSSQSTTFFADLVSQCYEVTLIAGNTMLIPTGWIHAVYTPSDTMVIGGNFLHGYNIEGQLAIYEIENKTNVDAKFRFPFYQTMLWYAAKQYLNILKSDPDSLSDFTITGLIALAKFLQRISDKLSQGLDGTKATKQECRHIRESIPSGLNNVQKLVRNFKHCIKKERRGRREATKEEAGEATDISASSLYPKEVTSIPSPIPDRSESPRIKFKKIDSPTKSESELNPAELWKEDDEESSGPNQPDQLPMVDEQISAPVSDPMESEEDSMFLLKLTSFPHDGVDSDSGVSGDEWASDVSEHEALGFSSDGTFDEVDDEASLDNQKSKPNRIFWKQAAPAPLVYGVPVEEPTRRFGVTIPLKRPASKSSRPLVKKPRKISLGGKDSWVIPNHSTRDCDNDAAAALLPSESGGVPTVQPVITRKPVQITVKKAPSKNNGGLKLFERLKKGLKKK